MGRDGIHVSLWILMAWLAEGRTPDKVARSIV